MEGSSLLNFLHAAEKLKHELRHSYQSTGRQESVAEHCWRLSLMVITIVPKIKEKVNMEKCLKMALIHDLPEIFAGDTYALDIRKKQGKEERERIGMKKLLDILSDKDMKEEIHALWEEYEGQKTNESRLIKLLDKLEVLIQHNEASLETWDLIEKKYHYGMAGKHAEKFGFLEDFAALIDEETKNKLKKDGHETNKLSKDDYKRFFGK